MNDTDKRYTNLSEHDYTSTFHDFAIMSMQSHLKENLAFVLDEKRIRKMLDRFGQEIASVKDAQLFLMEWLFNNEYERWVEESTPEEGK
jgi:hypothetical protein